MSEKKNKIQWDYQIKKFSVKFPGKHIVIQETASRDKMSSEFSGIFDSFIQEVYKWYDHKVAKDVWSGITLAAVGDSYYGVIKSRKPHFPGENRFVRELIEHTSIKGLMILSDRKFNEIRFVDGEDPLMMFRDLKLVLPPVIHKFMDPAEYIDRVDKVNLQTVNNPCEVLLVQNSFHALEVLLLSGNYKKIYILEKNPVLRYSIERNIQLNNCTNAILFKGNYRKFNELSTETEYDLWINSFKKSSEVKRIDQKKLRRLFENGLEISGSKI